MTNLYQQINIFLINYLMFYFDFTGLNN